MDNQAVVEKYHELDSSSGFIQTTGNYAEAFTPDRKQQFLDVYQASGLMFRSTCRKLGLSHHTVNHHIEIDPEFKAKFFGVQSDYAEELEAKQRILALEPKQFMDRAMQLRALLPGKYAREQNYNNNQPIQINISGDLLIDSKRRADLLDADVVKEITQESASMLASTMQPTDNNGVRDDEMKSVDSQHVSESST